VLCQSRTVVHHMKAFVIVHGSISGQRDLIANAAPYRCGKRKSCPE
jgi:hypothetical protein